jgi:hypothetical protein
MNYKIKRSKTRFFVAVFAVLAGSTAFAQTFEQAPTDIEEAAHAQWRQAITGVEAPSGGCFQATFPSTQWDQAPCRTVGTHTHPIPRRRSAGQSETTGNGNDYALVTTGLISQTVGSFPTVTGLTSESGVGVAAFGGGGILGPNEYTLQINTNLDRSTPACSGGAPGCTVWQQFVYATDYVTKGSGAVFMQYWLLGYGAAGAQCPAGFTASEHDCYKNSLSVSAPDVAITSLANVKLTGAAVQGGNDTVTFTNGTQAYKVSATDSVLQVATVWDESEFNVVGNADGSEAVFNRGTAITVNVAAQYGSTAAPTCESNDGTTGETNNLEAGPCTTAGGTTPSIQFTESLAAGQLLSYGDAGTPGNVSSPVVVGFGGWLQFQFLFAGENALGQDRIYAVDQSGELLSYGDAGTPGNVSAPMVVGFGGWSQFRFLFAGKNALGQNRIYAVNQNGQLLSYADAGTTGNVSSPVVVGFGGWSQFRFLFAGKNALGQDRIYAVNQNGQLLSYADAGTTGNVSSPVVVGFGGWSQFQFLFAGKNGLGQNRIYAVNQNGQLLSYGDAGTAGNVSSPVEVGFGGWSQFRFLFAGKNAAAQDRIYAVNEPGP